MLGSIELSLVDSVDEAQRFLSWLGERHGDALALDTETTGTERGSTVRLVQFGDGAQGWAIPTLRWRGVAEAGLSALRDSGQRVVLHNAQFDLHRLTEGGYPMPEFTQVEDTMILSRLAEPDKTAALKQVCSRLFGRESVAGQELLSTAMRENRWTWATVPDDFEPYWAYGALDTVLTAKAFGVLAPQVPAAVYDREMAVLAVMFGAESRGMMTDPDYTADLLSRWEDEAADLRALLQAQGIENPSSDHQVTLHLKAAGWEPSEFTDTGLPKLDKAVLTSLVPIYGEVAEPLLRYRRLVKWCSTYLRRFLSDGPVLYPQINTLAAKTGRMSITNPALQTLPSKESSIRNCIVPRKGNVLYAIDFSQIEMRMMAHYSGDVALEAAVRAEDLHRFCASLAYGVDPEQVTDLQRKIAKNTNFARLYGAGAAKIAETAGVPQAQIQGYMDAFDARFPGVAAFMGSVQHTAKARVAAEGAAYATTSGGRRVVVDSDKLYALTNYIIQGSAADVFKSAIVAVDCAGLGEFVVCPIHDELLFEFPEDEAAGLAAEAQAAMEDHTNYAVPMVCEVTGPLKRWGDAYVD